MNLTIVTFIFIGALFGLMSFSSRHLFSEGSTPPTDPGSARGLVGRPMWVAMCAALWPLLLVSGLFGWWHRRTRAARARR